MVFNVLDGERICRTCSQQDCRDREHIPALTAPGWYWQTLASQEPVGPFTTKPEAQRAEYYASRKTDNEIARGLLVNPPKGCIVMINCGRQS